MVGEAGRLVKVVQDENHCGALRSIEIAQQVEHVDLMGRVENVVGFKIATATTQLAPLLTPMMSRVAGAFRVMTGKANR